MLNGDFSYITALFSKYKIVNPKYEGLWHELYCKRDRLAYVNTEKSTQIILDNAKDKVDALLNPADGKPLKRLYHLFMFASMLSYYKMNKPFSTFFYNEELAKSFLEIKTLNSYNLEEVQEKGKSLFLSMINTKIPPSNKTNSINITKDTMKLIPRFGSIALNN